MKPYHNAFYHRRPYMLSLVVVLLTFVGHLNAGDFAEGNASSWGTFASDSAATVVSNDTNHVKAGAFSLRFVTESGFDTGVRFPGTGAAHWDLTTNTHLAFWHFATNGNSPTWQGNQPVVVLNCAGGSVRYEPQRQFTLDNAWSYVRVPLSGDAMWLASTSGAPSLADAYSLEIHRDTWGYGFTSWYDAVQFISVTNNLPPAGPPAPPGVNPDRIRPRVLMFAFDPIMTNKNNRVMHTAYGWTDPVQLTTNALNDLRRSSHDLIVPILEAQVHDAWPIQKDGFQYNAGTFDSDWSQHQMHDSEYDYKRFVLDWNLVPRILNGEVDEIWIYSGPFGGFWESTMAGDGGYWCNSGPVEGVPSSRLFVIMGLNFERGVGEAIHSWGHRAESVMVHSYEQWQPDRNNTWSHFTLLDKDAPGLGGVGNVHYPVNGQSDYDYANTTVVTSDADDWFNYSDFQGVTRSFDFHEWSPDESDPQRQYLNWWYAHMPHIPGRAPDNYLGNWWRYLWDVDQFKSWNGNLYGSEGIPTVAITSPTNNATVAGIVHVTADAAVSGALGRVDLYVDGQFYASDTLAPYTFDWDTRGLTANHVLQAKAYELQNGTESVSAFVTNRIRYGSLTVNVTSNGVTSQDVLIQWNGKSPLMAYAEAQANIAIPDNDPGGITNALGASIPLPSLVALNIGVTIHHPRASDLQIDLLTPANKLLHLKAANDASEKDCVTFYPEITAPIDSLDTVTIPRNYDDWRLVVRDLVAGSNGVLTSWSLRLNGMVARIAQPATNGPGHLVVNFLSAGIYTITPSAANRWFWPPTITITNVAESNVVNFIETAGPPPSIVAPPSDQIVYAGQSASFTVAASGSALVYHWQRSGTNLPGANTATLLFTNVQPSDLGLYSVIVSNANGWVVSPSARLAFAELTEGNASDWDTFASDSEIASVSDDTTHVKVSQRSVRFDTQSGSDTGVVYPRDGGANWDLTDKSHLVMWIYADNSNFAFQGNQPIVILKGPTGSFRYEPQQEVMPNHAWSLQQIPLVGNSLWQRTTNGTPSLSRIDQLEIHQDTWDAGFTIYYDGVEFKSLTPPKLSNPRGMAGGQFTFDFGGIVSNQYTILISTNLLNWTPLTTITATNFLNSFSAPFSAPGPSFYRVLE